MLNKVGENEHPSLVPVFREKVFSFSLSSIMPDVWNELKKFHVYFSESFLHDR